MTPSPEQLEREAEHLMETDAYVAGVLRACARQWRQERKDRDG